MQQSLGIILAVLAGTMAAMASVCAKLAMTAEAVNTICHQAMSSLNTSLTTSQNLCDSVSVALRVLCFMLIFLFNGLMWTFYTKSLQYTSSTVEATITNTGANFFVTNYSDCEGKQAVVGFVVFGESLSVLWWMGSCLILAGLLLIHSGSKDADLIQKEKVS